MSKKNTMISDKGILACKFLLVVLVSLFIVVSGGMKVRCLEREREALLGFKEGLIDEYEILSSWGSGDECCKWYGVECSNSTSNVISLQLNADYYYGVLRGKVTSSLLQLHHLYYLDLSNNDFGGHPIPQFIGSMKQLRYLNLRYSVFYGTVPPQLGNLTNLGTLDLSWNDFRGDRIPEFIGSMKQLQHLYLSESNFSGIIPPHEIGNLTNLRSLDLSYNYLRTTQNLDWLSNLSLLSFLDLSQLDLSHTNWLQHILSLHSLQELHLQSCSINDLKPIDAFDRLSLLEHLDLSSNMLAGEIPKSLSNLSHLRVLVLFDNGLRGNLDDQLTGNQSCSSTLQILDLSRNKFSGSVPDLRAFTALTEVYLDRNNFTGCLPLSLGQLSKLEALDVSHNYLKGAVSESHHLMKLHNLRMLDLSFNSLTLHIAPHWNPPFQLKGLFLAGCNMGPSFPKWIRTQRNISWLDISSAGIIDEVPNWLWSFSPSMDLLYLSDNQINGTIPHLSSTSITSIDVSSNKISGPIPLFQPYIESIQLSGNMLFGSISSICKIPLYYLWFLDLSDNQLSGEVPNCWENIPNLFSLSLSNNSFSGEIPHTLGSLQHFVALQLRDNNLSGQLPSTLRFCQGLSLIDVGGNQLTGYIPTWLGGKNIGFLNFGSNKFYGTIPPQICNLTRIQILDVSKNNLSGEIPDCFNKFTSLAHKSDGSSYLFGFRYYFRYDSRLPNKNFVKNYNEYSSVQWKGRESEYRRTLVLLKLIDFSSNRLIGSIPKSFSSMRELISLNLSRNNLSGNIIPDIGQMEMLECLDLSQNQLTGKIPTSMEQLHSLAFLDLSNNNLFGKIPTSTQLQSFNISSYAGNDGLCDPPLTLCPVVQLRPPTTNRGGNTSEKADNGFWRLSFMQEFGISMGFGFIVGFWGVVGSFIIKKSWRHAYFNFLDAVGDWFYLKAAMYLSKFRRG